MCGIAGIINAENSKNITTKLIDVLKHRGPDHQQVYSKDFCALGHARLSIIDVHERAHQPMEKHGLVIVFNGEIYNHQTIRKRLIKDYQCEGMTKGDTEVIIDLFHFEGVSAFTQLEGMFAFAILETKTNEFYLVRDYFGIKPLYFYQKNNVYAFASETKVFSQIPGFQSVINPMALSELLQFNWVTQNQSFLQNVVSIPPAHYYQINLSTLAIAIHQYWNLEESISKARSHFPRSYKEQKNLITMALEESLDRHLVCDVPMGIFLSGGLDSSLLAAMIHQRGINLKSFSVSFSPYDNEVEKAQDDGYWANYMAKKFNFPHYHLELKAKHLEKIPEVIYHLDTPLGDPAAINAYLLSQLAMEQGIKVIHSGMGADEIFGGYRRHKAIAQLSKIAHLMPEKWRKFMTQGFNHLPTQLGQRQSKLLRWGKRVASFWDRPLDLAYLRSFSYYDSHDLSDLLINNNTNTFYQKNIEQFQSIYHNPINDGDEINKMCYTDLHYFLEGLNLKYMDKMSMAHGVEGRVPFVDRNLIVQSMCIPGKYKIPFFKGTSKYLLKKISENFLEKKVIYRPKSSFGMPIRSWILRDKFMLDLMNRYLSDQSLKNTQIFHPQKVRKMIQMNKEGQGDFAYQLYQILSVQIWIENH